MLIEAAINGPVQRSPRKLAQGRQDVVVTSTTDDFREKTVAVCYIICLIWKDSARCTCRLQNQQKGYSGFVLSAPVAHLTKVCGQ